jgi:hypothetical protein
MKMTIIASVRSATEAYAVFQFLSGRGSLSHAASIRRHRHRILRCEPQHNRFYLFRIRHRGGGGAQPLAAAAGPPANGEATGVADCTARTAEGGSRGKMAGSMARSPR